ncbi:unnamed protein product [Psylliodes chrysocephalus]|uniref:THAP-type domain-containing protein n=1 Tax=Psylliodes chrysocephalus TaxID=3402493 RepID=A0A9P0G3Y5_9CUCU|nr:unnamed protein product [Psylliodes chrysocephala]
MGKGFPGCAAVGCTNNYGNNSKYSLFNFPKDEKRAKIWALAAGRNDLIEHMNKLFNKKICSVHFEDCMFKNERRNRLRDTAVPTIFHGLEGSSSKSMTSEQGIKRPFQSQAEEVVPVKVLKVTSDGKYFYYLNYNVHEVLTIKYNSCNEHFLLLLNNFTHQEHINLESSCASGSRIRNCYIGGQNR